MKTTAPILLALLLSACGGGGRGDTAQPDPPPEPMPLAQCSPRDPFDWPGDSIAYSFAEGRLAVHWLGEDRMYRLVIGPNGFNDLPNIASVATSPCLGDPQRVGWEVVSEGAADWLPPLTVQALAGGDGGPVIYTGGNHGTSGLPSGARTAANVRYDVLVGGRQLQDGAQGFAQAATVLIANDIMAYNTAAQGRYVVRQIFRVNITPGLVEVGAQVTALEDVAVLTDNGPQMTTDGHQASVRFHGGEDASSAAPAAGLNSGASAGSRAWAAEFRGSGNGPRVSWMDRSAGVGDGRYVAQDRPFIRIGNSLKAYHAAVAGVRLPLRAGEEYRWRGGYAWKAPDEEWLAR